MERLAVPVMRLALLAASVIVRLRPKPERPLQGYIEGEYGRVAAPFAGTAATVVGGGGEAWRVSSPTAPPVFALERENEGSARHQAEQQLQAAGSALANLRTGKRPAEVETVAEQLAEAKAARDLSAANYRRQQQLRASGFISAAAFGRCAYAVEARRSAGRIDGSVG
jgi:HlyD family secretion protein